ncbi:MAG: hypothetical protein O3A63_21940, partial [Proteobacteria bacterium]|nr:hypothetical protein [Pseudomonadota bacterium]
MATITFPDNLLPYTSNVREVEVFASTYRDLTLKLTERWPDLKEPLAKYSVAIDGQLYQDAFLEP